MDLLFAGASFGLLTSVGVSSFCRRAASLFFTMLDALPNSASSASFSSSELSLKMDLTFFLSALLLTSAVGGAVVRRGAGTGNAVPLVRPNSKASSTSDSSESSKIDFFFAGLRLLSGEANRVATGGIGGSSLLPTTIPSSSSSPFSSSSSNRFTTDFLVTCFIVRATGSGCTARTAVGS
uniref:Putative secreted peptide n=1 Tax=Anopheles braziliensis TaxID=58242 RepID=A0A2M3ZUT7_9DIPT